MQKEIMELIANDIVLLVPQEKILEKYDISRSTFYRIRNDKEFKQIISEKRTAIWENTIDTAYAMAEESARLLMETLTNTEAPLKVRMDAATKIITMAKAHYSEITLLSRLDEVEKLTQQLKYNDM